MNTSDRFEEMLAAYPADKRELARQVCCRFADGDSTEFFTQLLLVLDVYAHYYNRIPQTVIEANQSAQANAAKLRDEINLLAQAMDRRNVNITNHAERTDELCQQAIEACDATCAKVEGLVKNIGAQVDTKAIIDGVQTQLNQCIRDQIIRPFTEHIHELGQRAVPALKEIKEASAEAHGLWMKHIWKTAWTGSLMLTFSLFSVVLLCIYSAFEHYAERVSAEKIAEVERVMNYNQEAFEQLAIAQVPIKVVRTENDGVLNPQSFAIVIQDADSAEMRNEDGHQNGMVFLRSHLSEEQIQLLQQETAKDGAK